MADQLAAVNKANVQLQREFDAFKDLTAQVGVVGLRHTADAAAAVATVSTCQG